MLFFGILGVSLLVVAGIVIFFVVHMKSKGRNNTRKGHRNRERDTLLKTARRRLSQNAKDTEALQDLAELYYLEEDYKKSYQHYSTLLELVPSHSELDEFDITLKHAVSAMNLKKLNIAYKGFLVAKKMRPDDFDVNGNLGRFEYYRKNYEKAVGLLHKARKAHPEDVRVSHFLGLSLYKLQRYGDAIKVLRDALENEPDDKESLFALAQCYYELGNLTKALEIFTRMRVDPTLGPNACLYAGTINVNTHRYAEAAADFELGLKHDNIGINTEMELKYRLATALIKMKEIERALTCLKDIAQINPDYKDVKQQIKQYQDMSSNSFLQTYLISSTGEFVTLCRRIAMTFHLRSRTTLLNITTEQNEYVDIQAEVSTGKWEDIVLFRFIRSPGITGELVIREFHARSKDIKAGRGYCITTGEFSDGARQFVEARMIELISKKDIVRLFERMVPEGRRTKKQTTIGAKID